MTVRPATLLLSLAAGLGDALEVEFFAATLLTTGERDGDTLLEESVAAERTPDWWSEPGREPSTHLHC